MFNVTDTTPGDIFAVITLNETCDVDLKALSSNVVLTEECQSANIEKIGTVTSFPPRNLISYPTGQSLIFTIVSCAMGTQESNSGIYVIYGIIFAVVVLLVVTGALVAWYQTEALISLCCKASTASALMLTVRGIHVTSVLSV